MTASIPKSILLALPILVLAGGGCTSFRGARLYTSGTDALDRGDSGAAVADLEAAAALLPEASRIQNHLGLAYAQAGRDEEALAAFRRAVELDCGNEAAQHNLRAAEAGRLRPPREDGPLEGAIAPWKDSHVR